MTPNRPRRFDDGGIPRWVKLGALVVGVLILLFVVLQLIGVGDGHGPGLHGAACLSWRGDVRS